MSSDFFPEYWYDTAGKPIACKEKIAMLTGNMEEIHDICTEALEDAVLMGCDEAQIRTILHRLIDSLTTSFPRGTHP
jgi:glutathionylspermidine synthase